MDIVIYEVYSEPHWHHEYSLPVANYNGKRPIELTQVNLLTSIPTELVWDVRVKPYPL